MKVVYLAGPLSAPTSDGVDANIRRTMTVGAELTRRGYAVIVPHLFEYMDRYQALLSKKRIAYETWMAVCFELIHRCDAFFYMGLSPGADRERALAQELGKTIWRNLDEVSDLREAEPA